MCAERVRACADATDPVVKTLLVDSWAVDFVPVDHRLLSQTSILEALSRLAVAGLSGAEMSGSFKSHLAVLRCLAAHDDEKGLPVGHWQDPVVSHVCGEAAALTFRLLSLTCVDFDVSSAGGPQPPPPSSAWVEEEDDEDEPLLPLRRANSSHDRLISPARSLDVVQVYVLEGLLNASVTSLKSAIEARVAADKRRTDSKVRSLR
jgi:hypothetical protein